MTRDKFLVMPCIIKKNEDMRTGSLFYLRVISGRIIVGSCDLTVIYARLILVHGMLLISANERTLIS